MVYFKGFILILVLFQVLSSGMKSEEFNNIFVTDKPEGDTVIVQCEYFQKYVITLDGKKYFIHQNVISIDILE